MNTLAESEKVTLINRALELNRTLIDNHYGYHRLLEIDDYVIKGADPLAKEPKIEIFQKCKL